MNMEPVQKQTIRANLPDLIEYTICSAKFIAFLEADGVLGTEESHLLSDPNKSSMERAQNLYYIVQTRGNSAFSKLKNALAKTNQTGAYEILQNAECPLLSTHQKLVIHENEGAQWENNFVPIFRGHYGTRAVLVKTIHKDFPVHIKAANNEIVMLVNLDWYDHILAYRTSKLVILGGLSLNAVALDSKTRLEEYMVQEPASKFTEDFCRQLIKAVAFLHYRRIVHLNLRPNSVFVCLNEEKSPQIQIADFGVARKMNDENECTQVCLGELKQLSAGSYFTPEVLEWETGEHYSEKNVQVDFQTDTFCAGVILYYLLTGGVHPFGNIVCRPYFIKQGQICTLEYFDHVEANTKQVIMEMLSLHSQARPKMSSLVMLMSNAGV